jgi:hypothetical protein
LTDVSEVHTVYSVALMMETVSTSKMSVNFYESSRRNILEDSHLNFDFFVVPKYFNFATFSEELMTIFVLHGFMNDLLQQMMMYDFEIGLAHL